jgi:uncharacterized membrane protein HdeD (DUF308 family)
VRKSEGARLRRNKATAEGVTLQVDQVNSSPAPARSAFETYWLWAAAGGVVILLLGLLLLFLPVTGRSAFARTTGWFLVGAGMVELAVGLRGTPSIEGRIVTLLSAFTLAAALLVLLRPGAYPLMFVATLCLAIRGVGAIAAAVVGGGGPQLWVLARGLVDLLLGAILMIGAPVVAVITVLAGTRWPPSGTAVLGNFIAISMIAAGMCLAGLAWTHRRSGPA